MANSQETNVNLKINRVPNKATLEDMVANNQIQPNQLYMLPSELGSGVVTMQTKVLWTNSNPSSAMSPQTLTLDESMKNYDYIILKYRFNVSDCTNESIFIFSIKNIDYSSQNFNFFDLKFSTDGMRRYYIISDNQISFDIAEYGNPSILNKILLPYQFIGIKLIESPTQITNKYSTEETVVGEWIDGKKIYRKVFEFNSVLELAPNNWTNFASKTNENQIINAIGISTTYQYSFPVVASAEENNLRVLSLRNSGNIELNKIILEYTKTTD